MNSELQTARFNPLPERGETESHACVSAILARLGCLLLDLDRRRHLLNQPLGSPDEEVAVWHDQEYTYIDVRLPQDLESQIDVSSLGRKLFIRMGR